MEEEYPSETMIGNMKFVDLIEGMFKAEIKKKMIMTMKAPKSVLESAQENHFRYKKEFDDRMKDIKKKVYLEIMKDMDEWEKNFTNSMDEGNHHVKKQRD